MGQQAVGGGGNARTTVGGFRRLGGCVFDFAGILLQYSRARARMDCVTHTAAINLGPAAAEDGLF
jgi:hypothetical protein